MNSPIFLSVSGGMGAGKTTLARGLAASLRWQYIPTSTPAIRLLNDLFANPKRWAFETQVSFLIHKAVQVKDALQQGKPIVLDRTIFEEIGRAHV